MREEKISEMKTLITSLWPERWHRNCLWYLSMCCDGDDDDDGNADIRPHFEEPLIIIMMWLNIFITKKRRNTRVYHCFFSEATKMMMIIDCILMDDYVIGTIDVHVIRTGQRRTKRMSWERRACLCMNIDGVEVCIIEQCWPHEL